MLEHRGQSWQFARKQTVTNYYSCPKMNAAIRFVSTSYAFCCKDRNGLFGFMAFWALLSLFICLQAGNDELCFGIQVDVPGLMHFCLSMFPSSQECCGCWWLVNECRQGLGAGQGSLLAGEVWCCAEGLRDPCRRLPV